MDPATSQSLLSTPAAATFTPSGTYLVNLKASAFNITSSYFRAPPQIDWTRLPFQVIHQIDHALFRTFPRFLLQATGLLTAVENAGQNAVGGAANAAADLAGQAPIAADAGWTAFFAEAFQAGTFKSYLGMLQYLTSRWAFTCFAMALILNRISVYGASRQRIYLTWNKRLALRIIPILLFVPQIHQLLCGIRCQTSPEYSLYRHGDNDRYSPLDWSTDGGVLYVVSSKVLFGTTDEQACAAVGMSRPSLDVRAPYGSFALLWPSFLRLSVSHLAESLSCSLQQYPLMTEVGMSVFEHSLAFAEAETMITSTISVLASKVTKERNLTMVSKPVSTTPPSRSTVVASGTIMALSDAVSSLTSPHILDKVNVPVEVLLVALLSCGNALASNIISVLGKQKNWRLINTAFWGMCFMGAFIWGFATTSTMSRLEEGDTRPVSTLLHFPTVAIVGFLPHMVILLGIFVCVNIYLVALILTAISLGTNPNIPRPSSLKERFVIAHDNLQAAIQLRGINIRWHEDFYTALLRVGFAALTAASEAVFLNEGRSVEMRQFTWLEEERIDELSLARTQQGDSSDSHFQILEEYGVPSSSPGGTDKGGVWESGYGKERKYDKKEGELEAKDSFAYPTPRSGGIGAVQRTTRFYLLFIYIRGILFLIGGWLGFGFGLLLDRIGITARPRWLRKLVGRSLKRMQHERENMNRHNDLIDFWIMKDGKLRLPKDESVDIEPEMRKRIMRDHGGDVPDELLDEKMYGWWKAGGWFGIQDGSGEYEPSQIDEDITSVISMSSRATTPADDEWESEEEGQRTPTQLDAGHTWSFSQVETRTRESTSSEFDSPLDPATLARLLNPPDAKTREEARILASHLATESPDSTNSGRIMTRSRYRREQEMDRARVLLAGRSINSRAPLIPLYTSPPSSSGPLPPTEESEVLESLILARRKRPHPTGASDQDSDIRGPPCVVCHSSPRTIIAWPCRCLCVCEDCRVSLALNNFGNCVTCRRQVGGFVRLYVP